MALEKTMVRTSRSRGSRSSGDAPHCWRVAQRVVHSAAGTTARNWRFRSAHVQGPRGVAVWSQASRIPAGAAAERLRAVGVTTRCPLGALRSRRVACLAANDLGRGAPGPPAPPRGRGTGAGLSGALVPGVGWPAGARWSRVFGHPSDQVEVLPPLLPAQPEEAGTALVLLRGR